MHLFRFKFVCNALVAQRYLPRFLGHQRTLHSTDWYQYFQQKKILLISARRFHSSKIEAKVIFASKVLELKIMFETLSLP